MHDLMKKKFAMLATDVPNVDSAGAVGEFVFAQPVIITKVGMVVTTTIVSDNSNDLDFDLSRRPVAGSSSNAVALGQFKAIAAGVDPAAGSVIWAPCNVIDTDGETPEDYSVNNRAVRFEAPNADITPPETGKNPWLILPGQSFAMTLQSNAEADSGVVYGFVEYIDLPFNDGFVDQANMTEKTVIAAA